MFKVTPNELRVLKACLVEILYGLQSMPDAPLDLAVAGKKLLEGAPLEQASLRSEDVLIAQYVVKTTLAELVPEAELSARTGLSQLELWQLLDRLNAAARSLASNPIRGAVRRKPVQLARYLQIGLLGRVRPSLRGVCCAQSNGKIDVLFIFDGDVAELDRELVSLVETELLSHYDDVEVRSIRVDAPKEILPLGIGDWVFLRWEPGTEESAP